MADREHSSKKSLKRLYELLRPESKDLFVFFVYTIAVSILYLAIPLSAQILVNTVAASVLIQPLIIFSIALLISLTFLGFLRILQLWIIRPLSKPHLFTS